LLIFHFQWPLLVAASTLHFDDIEKRKKYETILFKEVYNEVVEIKVILLP
jgi:ethanolamine kinase